MTIQDWVVEHANDFVTIEQDVSQAWADKPAAPGKGAYILWFFKDRALFAGAFTTIEACAKDFPGLVFSGLDPNAKQKLMAEIQAKLEANPPTQAPKEGQGGGLRAIPIAAIIAAIETWLPIIEEVWQFLHGSSSGTTTG